MVGYESDEKFKRVLSTILKALLLPEDAEKPLTRQWIPHLGSEPVISHTYQKRQRSCNLLVLDFVVLGSGFFQTVK
jgi:hypothetical protein